MDRTLERSVVVIDAEKATFERAANFIRGFVEEGEKDKPRRLRNVSFETAKTEGEFHVLAKVYLEPYYLTVFRAKVKWEEKLEKAKKLNGWTIVMAPDVSEFRPIFTQWEQDASKARLKAKGPVRKTATPSAGKDAVEQVPQQLAASATAEQGQQS